MPTALISVANKEGLFDFANLLRENGWSLLASGGTAHFLRENNLTVEEVAEYTGSAEILDGRVKTLHPAIHGGILARETVADQAQLSQLGWRMIDMVVVNLYPFEDTIRKAATTMADAIEQIDIGGVALIRAAAKNHQRVLLICDPCDYDEMGELIKKGEVTGLVRQRMAVKGFRLTSEYDRIIAGYLAGEQAEVLTLHPVQALRYGENPHQSASLLSFKPGSGPLNGEVLHGKALSYNNLLDLNAALRATWSFDKTTVVIVKHVSPCGIASGLNQLSAYQNALACDPISAFGGVIALNSEVEPETAQAISQLFVECVIAPEYSPQALEILAKKKNIRLVKLPEWKNENAWEYRSIHGGILQQSIDLGDPLDADWKTVTDREPSASEREALLFTWKACQHVKSNAIVFARDEMTVGIGGGQPNRIDCVRLAAQRAGERAVGAVMASDAFFPFPDCVQEAASAGITAIIQPGGSLRDNESIEAANKLDIAMIFSGCRHFRH